MFLRVPRTRFVSGRGDSGWGLHGDRVWRVTRGRGGGTAGAGGGGEVLDPCRLHTADAGGGSLGREGSAHFPENGVGEREDSGGSESWGHGWLLTSPPGSWQPVALWPEPQCNWELTAKVPRHLSKLDMRVQCK